MLKKIIAFTVLATMVHPICAEAEDPRYQRIVELLESDNYQQGHRLLHDALADDTADTRIHLLYATGLSQQKYGFTRDIQLAVRVWEAAAAPPLPDPALSTSRGRTGLHRSPFATRRRRSA